MEEYTCTYLTSPHKTARAIYWAASLGCAMKMHNTAKPEYAEAVIKWTNGNRFTYLGHESKITL